jgi:hypothetical protein
MNEWMRFKAQTEAAEKRNKLNPRADIKPSSGRKPIGSIASESSDREWLPEREFRARLDANRDARRREADARHLELLGTQLVAERDQIGAYRIKNRRRK